MHSFLNSGFMLAIQIYTIAAGMSLCEGKFLQGFCYFVVCTCLAVLYGKWVSRLPFQEA